MGTAVEFGAEITLQTKGELLNALRKLGMTTPDILFPTWAEGLAPYRNLELVGITVFIREERSCRVAFLVNNMETVATLLDQDWFMKVDMTVLKMG
jgi:hypothetical protein